MPSDLKVVVVVVSVLLTDIYNNNNNNNTAADLKKELRENGRNDVYRRGRQAGVILTSNMSHTQTRTCARARTKTVTSKRDRERECVFWAIGKTQARRSRHNGPN